MGKNDFEEAPGDKKGVVVPSSCSVPFVLLGSVPFFYLSLS